MTILDIDIERFLTEWTILRKSIDFNIGAQDIVTTGTITSSDITIFDSTPILVFKDSNSLGAASVGFIEWRDSGGGRAGFFGNSSSGNDDLVWKNEQGGNIVIQTTGAGKFKVFANTIMNDNSVLQFRDSAIGIYSQADTFMDLFADGAVRIGNSSGGAPTNFSKFEPDGTLQFNGAATVWKDINMGAASLSGPPGLQPGLVNYLDETGADTGIATYGLAVGEGFSGQFEMQHDYKEGSDIIFHIHWQGITAPTGTDKVKFQLTYTVTRTDTTLNATTVIVVETDFDTQYEIKQSDFPAITGTAFTVEDQFIFTLQRIAASADEYGGEALAATVGIHYEVDTVGSRQVLAK